MDKKQINWWRRRLYISANNKQKSSDPYEFSTTPAPKETKQFKTGGVLDRGVAGAIAPVLGKVESRAWTLEEVNIGDFL